MPSQPHSSIQQAVKTIEEFFHSRQATYDVNNAWAQVRIDLITSAPNPSH